MDNNVLARLAAGDSKIWKFIYREYRAEFIARAVKKYNVTLEEAEDAFQVAAVRIMQKSRSGELSCIKKSLRSLFYVCFRNQLIDDDRKKDSCDEDCDLDKIVDEESFNSELSNSKLFTIRKDIILQVLPLLPKFYQKLYCLLACGKYDMATIAKKLNLKDADAVHKKKYKLITKLQHKLDYPMQ
jgi:RNA polymerase sigma factor (sigma-70 family)